MNHKANLSQSRFHNTSTRWSARVPLLLACAGLFISMAVCGAGESSASQTKEKSPAPDSGQSPASEILSPSATVSKPSSTDSKPAAPDVQGLSGRAAEDVEAALGKPTGKLQTAQGALWLYAEWRVQFDQKGRVLKVEKDQPVRLAKLDPQFVAAAEARAKAAAERAAAERAFAIAAAEAKAAGAKATLLPAVKIGVISVGGEQVELPSMLTEGKITIVDFYAEWCGPCRRISPRLEQFVKQDPDVVLLKIDIVNWNTPVTQQFGIKSVPNMRVFDRTKTQVGEATHDLDLVMKLVQQAKGS